MMNDDDILNDDVGLSDDEVKRVTYTDDAVVVTLQEPLTFKPGKLDDERTLEALTMPKKVKGKHLQAMDKASGEMGKTLALIGSLARIPATAAGELDARDVELIMRAMFPFLPKPQVTGRR